ncbi:hypothetical protein [Legionella fairfieldensis]|uniref:hypothetical protein n=1 Tax=Legionella fairfieldensis TaxID=45064 RepID=UPI0004915AA1|nr:hypothetical protein [Legionella fairfieldensis]
MTYFITENGSLLKKENGIWYIYSKNSSAPSPWHEIQTKPYRCPADYMDIKDFCDSVHSVDDSHYPYVKVIRHDMSSGTLELDNNEFVFFVKLEIDNSNLELLANDIKQRATYAEEVRLRSLDFRIKRRLEDLEGQLNRGSDKSVRTYTRPPIVREPAKIDSYKKPQ